SFMSHLEAEHNLDSFREKPEDIDIYLLCVNFANDFQPAAGFKDQKIMVLQDEFQKYRRPKVWAIKNLLSQVIYNLFENATKYADAKSLRFKKGATPTLVISDFYVPSGSKGKLVGGQRHSGNGIEALR